MIVCLAVYGDRLASLLETASSLRFFEVKSGRVEERGFSPFPRQGPGAVVDVLFAAGAQVLICGGVDDRLAARFREAGVRLIDWVGGSVEDVVKAYADKDVARLKTPGGAKTEAD